MTDMDIDKLKKQKQLNVQEQNAITEYRILSVAKYWRINGLPKALSNIMHDKGIREEKSIVVKYEQNFPGCFSDEGIIITQDKKFIKFEMDLSASKDSVIELNIWNDITDNIEINKSKKGTGATWGYLALKVLSLLNS